MEMDSQKRLILAMLLAMGFLFAWSYFFGPQPPPLSEPPPAPLLKPEQATATAAPAATPPLPSALPQRDIPLETSSAHLLFTTEGAGLLQAQLKGDKEREQEEFSLADGYGKLFGKSFPPPPHIQLVHTAPGLAPFWGTSFEGTVHLPDTFRYAVVEVAPQRISFKAEQGGLTLFKVFEFQGAHASLTLQVTNNSPNPQSGTLWVKSPREVLPGSEKEPSFFGTLGNQSSALCRTSKLHRETPNNDGPLLTKEGPVHFVAIDQQYFLAALYMPSPALNPPSLCRIQASPSSREADWGFPLSLPPGFTSSIQLKGYLGAKDLHVLSQKGAHLDETLDFGWWAVICKLLLGIMRFFYELMGNWGLAIIFLTVVVKLLLLPLTHKAMASAEQMKKLQPQITALREKYAKDKERLNMEMMKLYQTAKINPLGGCLPLLLQMPVWFALFTTLRTSYELYREPFFGPAWTDLTSKDPTYLLPILLGATMILMQKLQPQMMEKTQAFMFTWIMPVFFSFIMLNYPAGLALYILVNNVLSIGQQFALRRWFEWRAAKKDGTSATNTALAHDAKNAGNHAGKNTNGKNTNGKNTNGKKNTKALAQNNDEAADTNTKT